MPSGYLKHNNQVNRKVARGGGSHQSRSCKHRATQGNLNPPMMEDFSFFASKHASSRAVGTRVTNEYKVGECPICFETGPVVNLSKKCSWHESACFSCLRRIHVTDPNNGVHGLQLSCFHPQCQQPVTLALLTKHKLIRTPAETKKHHELVVLSKMKKMTDPRTVYCPRCDFPKVFSAKPSGDDRSFSCKSCRGRFLVSPDYATIRALEWLEEDKAGMNDGWAR
jgi:hypothetical protein